MHVRHSLKCILTTSVDNMLIASTTKEESDAVINNIQQHFDLTNTTFIWGVQSYGGDHSELWSYINKLTLSQSFEMSTWKVATPSWHQCIRIVDCQQMIAPKWKKSRLTSNLHSHTALSSCICQHVHDPTSLTLFENLLNSWLYTFKQPSIYSGTVEVPPHMAF